MILNLYKLEIFKMVRSLTCVVAVSVFSIMVFFVYGSQYYNSKMFTGMKFEFPTIWPDVLTQSAMMINIFSAVLLTLVIASEFDWRTGRQNIIDGVAKYQWFTAKLLLIPTIVLTFYFLQLVFAGVLGWMETSPASRETFEITRTHYLAISGVVLGVFLFSSIAVFFCMVARSAGPALGLTFAYLIIEQLINRTLRGLELDNIADCLPVQVINVLFRYHQYVPYKKVVGRVIVPPRIWETDMLFITAITWIVVVLLCAWLIYWKRDL